MTVHKIPIIDSSNTTASASDILQGKTAVSQKEMITGNIPVLESQTYTPGTTNIIIPKGIYLIGDQTVIGEANLVPENIKKGTTIFNTVGTYESSNLNKRILYEGYNYSFNHKSDFPSFINSLDDFQNDFLLI